MTDEAPSGWVNFGREQLLAAREASGLTNAEIAQRLGVSTSTWDRAVRTGMVQDEHRLSLVALFGIPMPDGYEGDRTPWIMLRALEDISAALLRIEQRLPPHPADAQSG